MTETVIDGVTDATVADAIAVGALVDARVF
ncbi:hypothetical protein J2Z64_001669 [Oceanobacillus polygoni]|uniref:Uncharacterized protein n=1 Tax=Oceanobacillus polygoni TaxID=1235259 RepID=A0A9X0YRF2_9BACI|nr:hypothetical protein [Oceanobacillus polygoni]